MALTDKAIQAAKAESGRKEIADGKDGLYLVVQPSGAKSWACRYRFGGKPRKATLGRYPAMDLATARTTAKEITLSVSKGIDPAPKDEPTATRATVETYSNQFLKVCKEKNRSWEEVQRQFRVNILPAIGSKEIHSVTADDVKAIANGLKDVGSAIMANRVFATLRKFFAWAVDNQIVSTSPVAGLKPPSKERSRERVLSWDEVAALWLAAQQAGQPFGPLVRLLILTGQRRDEVTGIRLAELDSGRTAWTIPGNRAKNGEVHEVPLTRAMLAELDAIKSIGNKWVFTTNGATQFSGHGKCKARLDAALSFNEPWRLHDLRRTVATGMAELRMPIHVIEAVLNHKSGEVSGIAKVYNRHDYYEEKARALVAWNRFVELICNDRLRAGYEAMKQAVRQREGAKHSRAIRHREAFLTAVQSDDRKWRRLVAKAERAARWIDGGR